MGRHRFKNQLDSYEKQNLKPSRSARVEMYDVWRTAVAYSNNVCAVLNFFPERTRYDLDLYLKSSALSISNNIAKGSKSKSKGEATQFLKEAVNCVHSTVANLYIANKWNYLRTDLLTENYQQGRLLAQRIQNFSTTITTE